MIHLSAHYFLFCNKKQVNKQPGKLSGLSLTKISYFKNKL